MLLIGIIIQIVIYPTVWFFQLFEHEYFFDVFLISIFSLIVQVAGFGVIMNKTKDADPNLYSQGRPFRHKLREEDEELASRKPTFAEND
jgi:hypothetical protein